MWKSGKQEPETKRKIKTGAGIISSATSDGGDEDDLGVVGEGRGPGGELVVDGDAEAVGGEREGVAGAEFVVELSGGGCGGREGFGAEAALFAEEGEVLEVDGFQGEERARDAEALNTKVAKRAKSAGEKEDDYGAR
jgi:hypothetical protein